jgi:hypothetical protein
VLVWSGHSSEEVSGSGFGDYMIIYTSGLGPAKFAGNLRRLSLADSRQQVAACCAK